MTLPLMGICLFSDAKNYVVPKFLEMYEVCCKGLVEPLVVGDRPLGDFPHLQVPSPGVFSEDMLIVGRDILRQEALRRQSPILIWQGVDCLYDSRNDLVKLLKAAHEMRTPVGALTSARADANHAVARRFAGFEGDQLTIPTDELRWHGLVRAGFPGADALAIPASFLNFDFTDHIPWYTRVERGMPNLCAEEFWCLNVRKAGHDIWVNTEIRTHHVHEDGIARRWPGEERRLEDLTWTT